ncbi:phage protein NinX family protein [Burkholderia arboris]|uniref:phage protein NinX family protein n=1 Tax=Burkholderia arboris TaxID=488730 RepID=UPI001CF4F3A5|nr:phage protein NinX family protein [Burkholderia arboris]MCA8045493.1 DUF2591 domain-containing protein [Burkholderia arboris]
MKVADLGGALLDYWVARAEGYSESSESLTMHIDGTCRIAWHEGDDPDSLYNPSTSWTWGGPIIERARIAFVQLTTHYHERLGRWEAWADGVLAQGELGGTAVGYGNTQLVAAMRAYVASKFGDEVPDVEAHDENLSR